MLVAAGVLSGGLAQARDAGLQWSVTIGAPRHAGAVQVHAQSWPVFTRHAPYRVAPAPLHRGRADARPTRWDVDGDGIPNRYDRLYNPRWDRDGDGIPNHLERRDGRAWRGR